MLKHGVWMVDQRRNKMPLKADSTNPLDYLNKMLKDNGLEIGDNILSKYMIKKQKKKRKKQKKKKKTKNSLLFHIL